MEKPLFGERLTELAVRIIVLASSMPRTMAGRHVGQQLLRSGTSAGANYREAQGAESRADFAHKMQLVLKELRETLYWIEITQRAKMVPPARLVDLAAELNELISISVKSVTTAKRNARSEQ